MSISNLASTAARTAGDDHCHGRWSTPRQPVKRRLDRRARGAAALGAGAVQLVAVPGQREAVPGGDAVLQPFDLGADEFDNFSAAFADQMVMVGATRRHLVERLLGVAEAPRVGEPRVLQQLHGPVNGREADAGMPPPHRLVERLQIDMRLRLQEHRHDVVTRLGSVQPLVDQESPPDLVGLLAGDPALRTSLGGLSLGYEIFKILYFFVCLSFYFLNLLRQPIFN